MGSRVEEEEQGYPRPGKAKVVQRNPRGCGIPDREGGLLPTASSFVVFNVLRNRIGKGLAFRIQRDRGAKGPTIGLYT